MPRKSTVSDIPLDDENEGVIENEIMEEPKEEPKEEIKSKGTPFTVYRVEKKDIIVVDEKGNGSRIPLKKEYENLKKGDTIYL